MLKKTLLALLAATLLFSGISATPANAVTIKVVSAPSITKYAKVGSKVSAVAAKFSLKTTKTTWQWYFAGKAIPKATASTYVVKSTQKTGSLKVVQTAYIGSVKKVLTSNVIYVGRLWTSGKATLRYTDANQTAVEVVLPQILPAPASVSYSWLRDNFDIYSDGTKTRTIGLTDRGATLAAKVVVKAPAGYTDLTLLTADIEPASVTRTYEQVWSDEFSGAAGSTVNETYWHGENGTGSEQGLRGWGNNERQYYKFENATQDGNGILEIKATTTGASETNCYYGPCEWYSSRIATKGQVSFLYGRLEARIKGAPGLGTWGAFWTLGTDIDTILWPWCGEIDVTELVGKSPNSVLGYIHGPGGGSRGQTFDLGSDWSQEYHTYAVDWLPDQVVWYVDGQKFSVINREGKPWAYGKQHYILLNLAMGGNLGGSIDPDLTDAVMKVDYVRFSKINGIGEVFFNAPLP
jgi:beta-glucanase (GH16 family)